MNGLVRKCMLSFVLGVFALSGVFADAIGSGQPAAFISLYGEKTAIGMTELNQKVASYKAAASQNGGDASQFTQGNVLDIMINDQLVLIAAKHEGLEVTDSLKDNLYTSQFSSAVQQYKQQSGVTLTQEAFDKQVVSAYGSVDNFKTTLAQQYLLGQYLKKKQPDLMDSNVTVSDDDIKSFYRSNATQFVNPECAKVAQIFIPFDKDDSTQDAKNKALMEKLHGEIENGDITFEKAVAQYSKDEGSVNNGGEIGWVTMDDTQNIKKLLGDTFFNACMETDVGKISDVITSTSGYHIIKVLSHVQAKFLKIDDPINPDSKTTVRDYISNYLKQQQAQKNYQLAINNVVTDLRKQATITKLV